MTTLVSGSPIIQNGEIVGGVYCYSEIFLKSEGQSFTLFDLENIDFLFFV